MLQCFDTVPDHFNPLPPHGGRLEKNGFIYGVSYISIHSLRMEGDIGRCTAGITFGYFNPLPPHGGRLFFAHCDILPVGFQSTPSAWRETVPKLLSAVLPFHFNPLPPHGGRRAFEAIRKQEQAISIHSLRMEGDVRAKLVSGWSLTFQSTPSAWRETHCCNALILFQIISIHSLRMEGDLRKTVLSMAYHTFQSTPSAWRET